VAAAPVSDEAAIEIDGLRKSYPPASSFGRRKLRPSDGVTEAVRGLSLRVRRGEIFAFLGPNGAGKTTTVEILEGFRRRDGGDVRVLGVDPEHGDRAWRAQIGIVLQEGRAQASLTVRETLELWASYYPHPRRVAETIALVGLEEKADDRVARLSGGQRRRLDVGLALIGDPDLVFLDEPTTGFDPVARRAAWSVIAGLRDLGKTVFLTTHYLDEAQELADRVAIIKDGRILAIGTPGELGVGASTRARVTWRDEDGALQTREVDDPTPLVHELTSAALAHGGTVAELMVTRPSLEDVYLELTAEEPEEATAGV
jgi:ABC-2 type transport system ATP-binding protein